MKLPLVIEKKGVEESLFPVRFHPKHASLQEELHAWAASTLGPAYVEHVDKLQLGPLVSNFWPNTIAKPPRRIITLLKLMYWLFLVDDTVDKSCQDPRTQVKALHADQICNSLLHAIFGCAADQGAPHAPFQEALPRLILIALQVLSEMRDDGMPPAQQARLQSQIITFLQSLGKEQLLSTAMAPPSLEEYIAFRSLPGATGILLLAAEYSLGIELSKEALASPLVKELQSATGDHINWLNDVFSFEKEFANKEHFNILYVLHMRNNAGPLRVDFEAAVSQAWEMIQGRQRDCARLTHEILLSPHLLASSPGLHSYAESLCLITSGNWLWSTQAARYKLQPHPPPQASLNGALKPFRGNALQPLALLKRSHQFGRASVGMFVSPCPMLGLAIGN